MNQRNVLAPIRWIRNALCLVDGTCAFLKTPIARNSQNKKNRKVKMPACLMIRYIFILYCVKSDKEAKVIMKLWQVKSARELMQMSHMNFSFFSNIQFRFLMNRFCLAVY